MHRRLCHAQHRLHHLYTHRVYILLCHTCDGHGALSFHCWQRGQHKRNTNKWQGHWFVKHLYLHYLYDKNLFIFVESVHIDGAVCNWMDAVRCLLLVAYSGRSKEYATSADSCCATNCQTISDCYSLDVFATRVGSWGEKKINELILNRKKKLSLNV